LNIVEALWVFLRDPIYTEDENVDLKYRLRIFMILLALVMVIALCWGGLLTLSESLFNLELGEHALETAFNDYPLWGVFAMAVIVAPLLEELIFRGPMVYFRNQGYFKIVFWVLTLLFGYVHLSNYEITTSILLFSPFLVMPQIILGAILGFIRVKFGLIWAIALHAIYNFVLLGPVLLLTALDIPIPT